MMWQKKELREDGVAQGWATGKDMKSGEVEQRPGPRFLAHGVVVQKRRLVYLPMWHMSRRVTRT